MRKMTGRQAFLDILQAAGVTYIFGNPGTTELPLMDVLVDYPDVQYFLTLQEGVAMAMADGYATPPRPALRSWSPLASKTGAMP
jgi:benzoylformate decarboxylase